jgi:hypothetical protein
LLERYGGGGGTDAFFLAGLLLFFLFFFFLDDESVVLLSLLTLSFFVFFFLLLPGVSSILLLLSLDWLEPLLVVMVSSRGLVLALSPLSSCNGDKFDANESLEGRLNIPSGDRVLPSVVAVGTVCIIVRGTSGDPKSHSISILSSYEDLRRESSSSLSPTILLLL